jgi:hypothetical protein
MQAQVGATAKVNGMVNVTGGCFDQFDQQMW